MATRQRDVIEQFLSTSELAARLRVGVQTLYDLRSQGRGPPRPPGRPSAALPPERGRLLA